MGNRHNYEGYDMYVHNGDVYGNVLPEMTEVLMTEAEVLYEYGYPLQVETFQTGFRMKDPIREDKFIVTNGKNIYKRYVYDNMYVYFLKRRGICYAWHFDDIVS